MKGQKEASENEVQDRKPAAKALPLTTKSTSKTTSGSSSNAMEEPVLAELAKKKPPTNQKRAPQSPKKQNTTRSRSNSPNIPRKMSPSILQAFSADIKLQQGAVEPIDTPETFSNDGISELSPIDESLLGDLDVKQNSRSPSSAGSRKSPKRKIPPGSGSTAGQAASDLESNAKELVSLASEVSLGSAGEIHEPQPLDGTNQPNRSPSRTPPSEAAQNALNGHILDEKSRYRRHPTAQITAVHSTSSEDTAEEESSILGGKAQYRHRGRSDKRRSPKTSHKKKSTEPHLDKDDKGLPVTLLELDSPPGVEKSSIITTSEASVDERSSLQPGAFRVRGIDYVDSSSTLDAFSEKTSTTGRNQSYKIAGLENLISARVVTEEGIDESERQRIWDEAQRQAEENVREAVLSEAVVASEAEIIDESGVKFSKRCVLITAFVVLLVVVAAIVSGIMAANKSAEPVTIVVTEVPATPVPTISSAPTASPTIANDICERALSLPTDGSTMMFSTELASSDGAIPSQCGSINVQNGGAGIWFSVFGSGEELFASTCYNATNFDTQMAVFSGSCRNLVCAGGNDQFCGNQSAVSWFGVLEQRYWVYVFGFGSSKGTFALSIESIETVIADNCTQLSNSTKFQIGTEVFGFTMNATFDNLGSCLGAANTGPGVFYGMEGTGGQVTLTTCTELTDFDTQLTVFTGSCDNLVCVAGNDDFCGTGSVLTFDTVAGTMYYVLVHGFEQQTGTFALTSFLENDDCLSTSTRQPVAVNGDGVFGSTRYASFDTVEFCGTSIDGPGVWYSVIGTGAALVADTCAYADFDTKLSVFVGGCSFLKCVGGNDDGCASFRSRVEWESLTGEEYIVLVHGYRDAVGDFLLQVYDLLPPENDACSNSTMLSSGTPILGSTQLASIDTSQSSALGNGDCGMLGSPGIWFQFVGSGSWVSLSTCYSDTDFSAEMSIFTGTCDNLACVSGVSSAYCDKIGSTVFFSSTAGTTYFVIVRGVSSSGFAVVGLSDLPLPGNDLCEGSTELTIGAATVGGATIGATSGLQGVPSVADCGVSDSPAVWYRLVGTGENLTVSTCFPETIFNSDMAIFSGECDSLQCLDLPQSRCDEFGVKIAFASSSGAIYHVVVYGDSPSVGNFGLAVSDPVENVDCPRALPMEVDGPTVFGSTQGAPRTDLHETSECVEFPSPEVWFRFEGSGDLVTVSTCHNETDFDTRLVVFTGTCDNLDECFGGNDDSCGLQSSFTFQSIAGITYHVLLEGYQWAAGVYGLSVTSESAA